MIVTQVRPLATLARSIGCPPVLIAQTPINAG
jgi:hypothetical protein